LTEGHVPSSRDPMGPVPAAVLLSVLVAAPAAAGWTPHDWADASTIELRTTAPGEAAHWFPVWLVVIDDQVYVRLGARAAGRIASNQTAPFVDVRIAGEQFGHLRGVPAPDYAERVANGMGAKYWSDVVIRHFSHPLTLRLVPEPGGDQQH